MEQHVKMIVVGLGLFVLGGLSVYLLTYRPETSVPTNPEPLAQSVPDVKVTSTSTPTPEASSSITNAESFYEAAEARREQLLAEKAEADRLAKLKAIKERSVECKFWKQQQKTSSAAAKIDEKINTHCNLPSSASESSATSDSSAPASSTTSSVEHGDQQGHSSQ